MLACRYSLAVCVEFDCGKRLSVANYQIGLNLRIVGVDTIGGMRDFLILILFVHVIVTLARLAKPGGLRS